MPEKFEEEKRLCSILGPYLRQLIFGRRNVKVKSKKPSWNDFWAP